MSVDEHALMYMSVDAARTTKWNAGRHVHSPGALTGEFIGNPVECLHAEGIDSLNYIGEIQRQNLATGSEIAELFYLAHVIVLTTRAIHNRKHSRDVARERLAWETRIYGAAKRAGIEQADWMSAERLLEYMAENIVRAEDRDE